MDLRKDWKGLASGVATVITTFWALQEIAKNYGVTITMPTDYLSVLAFVGLTAFPLWLGYQVRPWLARIRRPSAQKAGVPRLLELVKDGGEVKVIGANYSRWVDCRSIIIDRIAQKDVSFTFLAPDLARIGDSDSHLRRAIDAGLIQESEIDNLKGSLKTFSEMRADLDEKHRWNIHIGSFDLPLTHSMAIAIPKTGEKGEVHLWPYLYGVHADQRPTKIYEYSNPEDRPQFEKCLESYRSVEKPWKDKQSTPQPIGGDQLKGTKQDEPTLESDVNWHLTRDIQPCPPFGSEDMSGSDKASKLHLIQRGKNLTLTGDMNGLKPSHMYHVQRSKPYTPMKLAKNIIIGAENAPYAWLMTDESGSGAWRISMEISDLTRHGIIDRFAVWVNDAPKNASVLGSDNIPFRLD